VNITLNFQRRSLFYFVNFILPCFIISICSLVGFILPADKGEKIGLRKSYIIYFYYYMYLFLKPFIYFKEITNLLGVVTLTQNVATIIPSNSSGVPQLSKTIFL